jgi:hypothetical protein
MTERVEIYHTGGEISADPANTGIREQGIEPLLRSLREAGVQYRVIDVSERSREELQEEYLRLAMRPSVSKRYRVKRIFGTNKYTGAYFGRGVPALVVLEDERPVDVYPHEEEGGRIVTIADYVARVRRGDDMERRKALVRRTDALRKRIGKLDLSWSDIIREGRER